MSPRLREPQTPTCRGAANQPPHSPRQRPVASGTRGPRQPSGLSTAGTLQPSQHGVGWPAPLGQTCTLTRPKGGVCTPETARRGPGASGSTSGSIACPRGHRAFSGIRGGLLGHKPTFPARRQAGEAQGFALGRTAPGREQEPPQPCWSADGSLLAPTPSRRGLAASTLTRPQATLLSQG